MIAAGVTSAPLAGATRARARSPGGGCRARCSARAWPRALRPAVLARSHERPQTGADRAGRGEQAHAAGHLPARRHARAHAGVGGAGRARPLVRALGAQLGQGQAPAQRRAPADRPVHRSRRAARRRRCEASARVLAPEEELRRRAGASPTLRPRPRAVRARDGLAARRHVLSRDHPRRLAPERRARAAVRSGRCAGGRRPPGASASARARLRRRTLAGRSPGTGRTPTPHSRRFSKARTTAVSERLGVDPAGRLLRAQDPGELAPVRRREGSVAAQGLMRASGGLRSPRASRGRRPARSTTRCECLRRSTGDSVRPSRRRRTPRPRPPRAAACGIQLP